MSDVHSPEIRTKNMKAIRGVNTQPEITLRKLLHSKGYRYRVSPKNLPSKPDIYLSKYKAVILVNGCFWHGHKCHLFKWPKSKREFWRKKISGTISRDKNNIIELQQLGIKCLVVWECAIKGKKRLPLDVILQLTERWLNELEGNYEITSQGLVRYLK